METLLQDVRYAVRQLRTKPRFTVAVLLTLSLGLGANTAVFSLANWVVLRPVPGVRDPGRLAVVQFSDHDGRAAETSYPNVHDLGTRVTALSAIAGQASALSVAVHVDGQPPEYVGATFVSANYFAVLGTRLAQGRAFTAEDEIAAAQAPVAVISHRFWHAHFASNADVVGKTFTVNGLQTRVIGVAPSGFRGTERLGDADLWIPGSASGAIGTHQPYSPLAARESGIFDELIGRLAPGATIEQARAQLRTAVAALAAAYPQDNARWTTPAVYDGIGVPVAERAAVHRSMLLLAGIAALVLLIACANVANLFLFRGMTRRAEWAVRKALGAPIGRLIRMQLIESVVLSLLAAVPAMLLGVWCTALFRGQVLTGLGAIEQIHLDWRVFAFASAIALTTGVVSGLAPALTALRVNTLANLRAGATQLTGRSGWLRGTLASVQLALSLSLLVGTLLLTSTVRNLRAVNVGFDADSIVTFAMSPASSGYARDASLAMFRRALARIQEVPGVESAALSATGPFMNTLPGHMKAAGAAASDSGLPITSAWVTPGYFHAMGIALLEGRTFTDDEIFGSMIRNPHPVVIISKSTARRLFGGGDPVGRTVWMGPRSPSVRVIGVVADSRWSSLTSAGYGPVAYIPLPNVVGTLGATFVVRTPLTVSSLRAAVQHALADVAPSVPLFDMMRLRQRIDATVSEQGLLARLLTAFTLLAVLLAVVGLYAVIAFSVAERTRELGIRIALGARAEQIVTMVVRRGAALGAVGIVIGLGGAVALSRVVASQLFGVSALDPNVYVLAAALLFALVLLASIIPARHATRVDPVIALRAE